MTGWLRCRLHQRCARKGTQFSYADLNPGRGASIRSPAEQDHVWRRRVPPLPPLPPPLARDDPYHLYANRETDAAVQLQARCAGLAPRKERIGRLAQADWLTRRDGDRA